MLGVELDNEELLADYADNGSAEALDELVRRNQNLLHHILQRFAYADEPYEDLVQVANLGLIKAAQRFDAARGVQLLDVRHGDRRRRVGRHLRLATSAAAALGEEGLREIQAASDEFIAEARPSAKLGELAAALNIDEGGILGVLNLYARVDLHSRNEPFARRAWRPTLTGQVRSHPPGDVRAAHRGPGRAVRRLRQAVGLSSKTLVYLLFFEHLTQI